LARSPAKYVPAVQAPTITTSYVIFYLPEMDN